MTLRFTKMHGAGNDFVVLDGFGGALDLDAVRIRALADRHFGIGCDQVLVLEPPTMPRADARYRIFNADGAEVEQCGNGTRCVADWLLRRGRAAGDRVVLESKAGLITVHVEGGGQYRVDMGVPRFDPARDSAAVAGATVHFTFVSMGNPHAVVRVPDVDDAPLETLGPALQAAPLFPDSVNVGVMEVCAPDRIRLRVYERGVGETLACGSGACAAVAAGRRHHGLAGNVHVQLKGETLLIQWQGDGHPVWMTGPATTVFEGSTEA
jgi:diaminopimelate epimerase